MIGEGLKSNNALTELNLDSDDIRRNEIADKNEKRMRSGLLNNEQNWRFRSDSDK